MLTRLVSIQIIYKVLMKYLSLVPDVSPYFYIILSIFRIDLLGLWVYTQTRVVWQGLVGWVSG